jgi:hypothetical protein
MDLNFQLYFVMANHTILESTHELEIDSLCLMYLCHTIRPTVRNNTCFGAKTQNFAFHRVRGENP